jgi:hypothetical protein
VGLTAGELRRIRHRLQDVQLELERLQRRTKGYDRMLSGLIGGAQDAVADAVYEARDLLWGRREASTEPSEPQSLKA